MGTAREERESDKGRAAAQGRVYEDGHGGANQRIGSKHASRGGRGAGWCTSSFPQFPSQARAPRLCARRHDQVTAAHAGHTHAGARNAQFHGFPSSETFVPPLMDIVLPCSQTCSIPSYGSLALQAGPSGPSSSPSASSTLPVASRTALTLFSHSYFRCLSRSRSVRLPPCAVAHPYPPLNFLAFRSRLRRQRRL